MLKSLRLATLGLLRGSGIFTLVANSKWRQRRLLILCYHGISIEDEHLWRPRLFVEQRKLEQRFEYLKKGNFSVLPLGDALQRMRMGNLPPRTVVLTFDDGTYDFFRQAYPLLKAYGFPATVYQTTYYIPLQLPVFNVICSYMLWKRQGEVIDDVQNLGLPGPLDLRTDSSRAQIVRDLLAHADRENLSGLQRDEIAGRLASALKIDYAGLKAKRILQLMNGHELQEISRNGIDIQLHTHRHRAPENEILFRKEIQDNRTMIHKLIGTQPVHFCYPSGVYLPSFFPWLRDEQVVSATTCDAGLVRATTENLLLPRFVDQQNRTQIEFESWITGVGDLLAVRRKAAQKPAPQQQLSRK
ncbi:MAG: polysaccharide deacetylase family protein [Candidatus Sulfotelmatobacter sp.]